MPPISSLKKTILVTGLGLFMSQGLYAQVRWVGLTDGDWSLSSNWENHAVLNSNGTYQVELKANSASFTPIITNNDLTGLTLARLAIEGVGITTPYTVNGNNATLTGNIVNRGTKPLTLNLGLRFLNTASSPSDGARLRIHSGDVGGNESLIYLNGILSGASDSYVFLTGAREIFYGGTQANTFAGTTVMDGGVLVLNKSEGVNAIAGPLHIRVAAAVRLGNNDQIDDSATVTFGLAGSRFQLNGFDETLGNIVSETAGAGIIENRSANSGTLILSNIATNPISFSGMLLNGEGGGVLNLTKAGANILTLNSASTYTGKTTVSEGALNVAHAGALGGGGSLVAGTSVSAGGRVLVKSGVTVANEVIEINGSGGGDNSGALRSDSVSGGISVWNGEVHLGAASGGDPATQAARVGAGASELRIGGKITDNGQGRDLAVRSVADGYRVVLSNPNNSYRGTYVVIGELWLGASNALPQNSELHLGNNSGFGRVLFDLNGFNQTLTKIGTIGQNLVTRIITNRSASASTLTWRVAPTTTQVFGSSLLSETSIAGSLNLTKADTGTLELGGANTYMGATTVSAGSLVVAHANALGASGTAANGTTVSSGANLSLKNSVRVSNEILRITGNGGDGGYGALRTSGSNIERAIWDGTLLLGAPTGGDPHTGAARIGSHGPVLEIAGKIDDEGLGRDLGIRSSGNTFEVVISGTNNTYRNTYLVIGRLHLGGEDALSTGGLTLGNSANTGSQTFDLKGFDQEVAGLATLGNASSANRITNTSSTVSVLTLNPLVGQTFTFNANAYTSTELTGNLDLIKKGLGTQILGGLLSHTGRTEIQEGTLALLGVTGAGMTAGQISQSSAIAIFEDAVLDVEGVDSQTLTTGTNMVVLGHGEIRGNLAVQGTLAPGTIAEPTGSLTVTGNLNTESDSTLRWDLASPGTSDNDRVSVGGNLDLSGSLQIQAQVGFGVGTYTLFDYQGTQSQNLEVIDTPVAYTATLEDSTPNQIKLRVQLASGWQIWDGAAVDAVTIEGGSGMWTNDPAMANWTDENSIYQSAWDAEGMHGSLFTNQGGNVTVAAEETLKTMGMVFEVDGYTLLAGDSGSQIQLHPHAVVEVFGGAKATISVPLSGERLVKTQAGTLVLRAPNGTLETVIQGGTLEIGEGGNLGLGPVTNDATLAFAQDSVLRVASAISGTGEVIQRGLGTTVLVANHSYTGVSTIASGTMQLGEGGTSGEIASSLIQNDGTLVLNRSNLLTLTQNVSGSGKVVQLGSGTSVLKGIVSYQGDTEVQSGVLRFESDTSQLGGALNVASQVEFAQTSDSAFKQRIIGAGDVVSTGKARLDLTQASLEHSGKTMVRSGTLASDSMPQAVLQLHSGSVYQPFGNAAGTVQVRQLQLLGGRIQWDTISGSSDLLVSQVPALLDGPTAIEFTTPLTENGIYQLIQNVPTHWDLDLLSASNFGTGLNPSFYLNLTNLYFSPLSQSEADWVTGSILQNSSPVSVPTSSGFRVIGNVSTGLGNENNQIRELSFADGSELRLHQTLTVTQGDFTVAEGNAETLGDNLVTPQDLRKIGQGTLTLRNAQTEVGSKLKIEEGALVVARSISVGSDLQLAEKAGLALRGSGSIQAFGNVQLAGTSQIDGSLKAPKISITKTGLLKGNGTVIGKLYNHGNLEASARMGGLTIRGDFTQSETGLLKMEIDEQLKQGLLKVTGVSHLGGTLTVSKLGGGAVKLGDRYVVMESGKFEGEFAKIFFSGDQPYRARFLVEKREGAVIVAPRSYQSLAQTLGQRRIAESLDTWIGADDADKAEVTVALDTLRAEEYPEAFESMQPQFQASAMEMGREMSHQSSQMLHQHLSTRRLGQRVAAAQADGEGDGSERPLGGRRGAKFSMKESVLPYEVDEDRSEVWVQTSGVFSSGGMSLAPGEDWESGSLMVGVDYAMTEHFGVGIYTSYQGGRGDFDHGGDINMDSARVGLYATYDRGAWYFNAAVGLGQTEFDIKRPIRFGSLSKNAYSEPEGWEWSAMFGGGYDFQLGKWTVGPQFSVTYQELNLGSFKERGAGALNLRVQETRLESLRSLLGGRIAYTLQVNEKLSLFPEVRAFWQHEYMGGSHLTSRFVENSGPEWTYTIEDENPDSVFLGSGFSWMYGSKFGGSLFYHATFGRNDDVSHTLSLMGNWKF